MKVFAPEVADDAPDEFLSKPFRSKDLPDHLLTIQVAPDDCTGCAVCVDVCPAKSKTEVGHKAINMEPVLDHRDVERRRWDHFLTVPPLDRSFLPHDSVKGSQVLEPLFEFSGACGGCGETPYIKLVTQLFGDRMLVANATGCSSIYGGNLPTTPYTINADGRGPTWSNSLFEDNAEFGFGFRVSIDKQTELARELLPKVAGLVGDDLVQGLLEADQHDEAGIAEQRERLASLKHKLAHGGTPEARLLLSLADMLVRKSVWIVGGDGWAYDIGYGGLDHVIASDRDVNILVLDTEVYSNTGGQMSKATPRGAVAKFAAGGKPLGKKDLGLIAMSYGHVYVASVAMGAKDEHTLKAFLEAEAYRGPSLIIAYSHCIAHGIDMAKGMTHQKALVDSNQWLLYRYHPDRAARGENPLLLDSQPARKKVAEYLQMENRFKMLTKSKPEVARRLFEQAQVDVDARWRLYGYLAARPHGGNGHGTPAVPPMTSVDA
jgi:pyruvate-ferredoxin/flavodoxin oxidoreductase